MIVTCPNCTTRFNLPDEVVKPRAKLRCSVCKYVFNMPDDIASLGSQPPIDAFRRSDLQMQGKRKSGGALKGAVITLIILLVLGCGAYGVWTWTPWADGMKQLMKAEPEENTAEMVRLIALRGVRQYNINNEKSGNISVIEGKTVNGFPEPRELIRVEASLYDADGLQLVSKQQLAGTSVSLFQLQVLGDQELEQALSNKIDILSNNTNVQPGGEVPFMVVFYNPPDNATEFGVKVIDARLPPTKK